jgi:hypothetical protein
MSRFNTADQILEYIAEEYMNDHHREAALACAEFLGFSKSEIADELKRQSVKLQKESKQQSVELNREHNKLMVEAADEYA